MMIIITIITMNITIIIITIIITIMIIIIVIIIIIIMKLIITMKMVITIRGFPRAASTRPAGAPAAAAAAAPQEAALRCRAAVAVCRLRANGVVTNGAAAKVMNFDRLGRKRHRCCRIDARPTRRCSRSAEKYTGA